MLPVWNLLPKAGRPEATLATQDASPEQSVPAGVSPPGMYGVPETCEISDMSAARANMKKTLTANLKLFETLCLGSLFIMFAQLENKNGLCFQRNTERDTYPQQQINH
jgi:hypothetical protein